MKLYGKDQLYNLTGIGALPVFLIYGIVLVFYPALFPSNVLSVLMIGSAMLIVSIIIRIFRHKIERFAKEKSIPWRIFIILWSIAGFFLGSINIALHRISYFKVGVSEYILTAVIFLAVISDSFIYYFAKRWLE